MAATDHSQAIKQDSRLFNNRFIATIRKTPIRTSLSHKLSAVLALARMAFLS